jgi:hypothetical protein
MTTKKHSAQPKRPSPTPNIPPQAFKDIGGKLADIKAQIEEHAAHLRPQDRMRLNGIGIKKQGFVYRTYDYATESPEFLPQYLPISKFKNDEEYFNNCRILFEECKQIQEMLWNLTIQAADVVYTDSLEYYTSVRNASKHRIDGAESISKDLESFFKHKKPTSEETTKKGTKRNVNALLSHKRGGIHKVIDEIFEHDITEKETKT